MGLVSKSDRFSTGVSAAGTTVLMTLDPISAMSSGDTLAASTGGFTPTPDFVADATGVLATGTTTASGTGIVSTGVTVTSPTGMSGTVTTGVAVDAATAEKLTAASDTKKTIATTVADKAAEVVKKDWVKPVAIVALLFVALFTGYKLFVGSKAVAA